MIGKSGSSLGKTLKRDCNAAWSVFESVVVLSVGWDDDAVGCLRAAVAALSRSTRRSLTRRDIASRCRGCVRRVRR